MSYTLEEAFLPEYRHLELDAALRYLIGDLVDIKTFQNWRDVRSGSGPFNWIGHMTHWTAGSDTTNACIQWCFDKRLVQFYLGNEDQSRPDNKPVLYIYSNGRMGHSGKGNSEVITLVENDKPQKYVRHKYQGSSYAGYEYFSGIEVEASGSGVWTQAKFDGAFYLAAALCILTGRGPNAHIHHAQWTSRKLDTIIYPNLANTPWPQAGSAVGWNGSIDYVDYTALYIEKIQNHHGTDPNTILLPGTKPTEPGTFIKPPVDYVIRNFNRVVGLGDEGDDVFDIQTFLRGLGVSDFNPGRADAKFGTKTKEAVQKWQTLVGIGADGLWGSQSRNATAHKRWYGTPTNWRKPIFNGARGSDVAQIQSFLNHTLNRRLEVDGIWGKKTEQSVNQLRQFHSLVNDKGWDFELWHKLGITG